ncbi:MAG TPA: tetratricopeptide repeat protein [Spirochaetales bacterium]|nr:tetratricopeptide repeat protein [Spirochaetales bacterium]HPB67227.1 tetratricopeptide repeat protein [Spirochaetales bacterium]HPG86395.1 tetratricopeptide repeat protein [Spirochaetales bacterium]HPM72693.1 tetratricopeptide repeat protein [Spirochaetales bacterium]
MISEDKRRVLDLFAEGRKLYKLMRFSDAADKFDEALKIDPTDGPSKVYLDRCDHYVIDPPDEDWDGVFVMKHK